MYCLESVTSAIVMLRREQNLHDLSVDVSSFDMTYSKHSTSFEDGFSWLHRDSILIYNGATTCMQENLFLN